MALRYRRIRAEAWARSSSWIQWSFYGEVGVRSGVQHLDFLLLGIASRQDKNGGLLQLPEPPDDGHAVSIGDSEIQDDQDIVETGIQADCLGIGFRVVDLQGSCLQAICDFMVQFTLLCDDQCFTTHELFPADYSI